MIQRLEVAHAGNKAIRSKEDRTAQRVAAEGHTSASQASANSACSLAGDSWSRPANAIQGVRETIGQAPAGLRPASKKCTPRVSVLVAPKRPDLGSSRLRFLGSQSGTYGSPQERTDKEQH